MKKRQGSIFESRERRDFIDVLKEVPVYDDKDLDELELRINSIDPVKMGFPLMGYLKEYGWIEGRELNESYLDENGTKSVGVLTAPTLHVYERLLEILENLIKRMDTDRKYSNRRYSSGFQQKLTTACDIRKEVAKRLEVYAQYAKEETKFVGLFDEPALRIVDLLVIDEVHAFYLFKDCFRFS